MLERERIFSKFNVTDYNTRLEEILERKDFSEEAENLLLSMFYKIEGSYKDYEIVKHNDTTEKDFIEKIMQIIDINCNKIIVIKPIIDQYAPKYKVNKKEKTIEVFPNEFYLLYAICKLGEITLKGSEDISFISRCMLSILNIGETMNKSEVIRDFTGWSWTVETNEIQNPEINIFYNNMKILLGESFIQSNLSNKDIDKEIHARFIYIFGKEQGKVAIKKMEQVLLAIYSNMSTVKKKNVLYQIKKIESVLDELENKIQFTANIKEKNAKKIKIIKKIDKILSNIELIRKHFIKTNEKLSDNEKIFSISHFVEKLEADKKRAATIISENNSLINPLNFERKINDVQQELQKYKELKINSNLNADIDKHLIEFQKIFFEGVSNKIKNASTKKELISLIYEIRYYNHLTYKNGVDLRFDRRLVEDWEDIIIQLVEKLLDADVIDVMAEDGKLNYDIVKYIFLNKIIKIENINVKMTKYNNKIEVEYYDVNMLEDKVIIESEDINYIKIKSERRVKLFA